MPCTKAPKIYIIATVKNRETSSVTEVVYVPEKVHTVLKKKNKKQKERRPPEGERGSGGYLYSVGEVSSKKRKKKKDQDRVNIKQYEGKSSCGATQI